MTPVLPDAATSVGPWIIYIAFAAGGLLALIQGWKSQRKPINAPNAIVAGDIMDTKPMKDLAEGVKALNEAAERMIEAQDRTTAAVDRASAATDRNEAAVRDLCRAVERTLR